MATQTVQQLPPEFVRLLGEDLAKQVIAQSGVPVISQSLKDIKRFDGETDDDFAARQQAAREFDVRLQNLFGLRPQVADQDPLQRQAQETAIEGLGAFRPFMERAQAAGTRAGDLLGAAGTGIGSIGVGAKAFQQEVGDFMSPYQSQVIDATLAEFDRNRDIQQQQVRDQQTALGALGAGRAGVQLAEFGTGAARERALLQANLLMQGFGQAQQARQQDIANRFGIARAQQGLARQQQGLGAFQAGLGAQQQQMIGRDVAQLGTLGALNQAQAQARLDADREARRQAAFLPQQQLDRFASQVTGIMGGYPGATTQTVTPNPTPLQTALGVGTTLAGIYGAFNNPGSTDFGRFITGGR